MRKGRRSLKAIIKTGLLMGVFYAIGMALFDYFNRESFSSLKLIYNLLFFGGIMGYMSRYKHIKE